MKRLRYISALAASIVLLSANCFAQYRTAVPMVEPSAPDVLFPEPRYWFIAPQVGINLNEHPGDFVPRCDQCLFGDGSGTGLLLGIQVEHWFNAPVGIALKLLYDDKRADYTTPLPKQPFLVRDPSTGSTFIENVDVERTSRVELSYLVINPVFEFFPFGGFYVLAGPAVGFKMKSFYDVKEKILDDRYEYLSTKLSEWEILTDVEVKEPEDIRFDVRFGAGYYLKISPTVSIAPEVIYEVPLTRISSDDNWYAKSLHILAVLRFEL